MAPPQPVVLFVGTLGAGKSTIAGRLLGSDRPFQQQLPSTWRIDNKYYSADVSLHELDVPLDHAAAAAGSSAGLETQAACSHAEAVVLVVDASQQGSFHAVRAWAEGVGQALMEGAQVHLLLAAKVDLLLPPQRESQSQHPAAGSGVGLEAGASSREGSEEGPVLDRPEWLLSAADWCAEGGVEYIEVCGSDARLDAQLHLDGEGQGVARVVEALQSHMWPGMRLKERGAQGQGEGRGLAGAGAAAGRSGGEGDPAAADAAVATAPPGPVAATVATGATTAVVHSNGNHGVAADAGSSTGSRDGAADATGASPTPADAGGGGVRAGLEAAHGGGASAAASGLELPGADAGGDAGDSDADDPEAKEVEAFDKMFLELAGGWERSAGGQGKDGWGCRAKEGRGQANGGARRAQVGCRTRRAGGGRTGVNKLQGK